MVACAIRCCRSNARVDKKGSTGITFHRFPKDIERRKVWTEFVNRPNWEPAKYSTICSKHFLEEHIDRTSLMYVRLKENAIPTVYGYQLQDIKTEDSCKIEVVYNEEPSVTKISEDVNRHYWEPSKCSTICSKHVLEEGIDQTSLNCVGLRENAIPTVGDGYQLQDIKTEDSCKIEVVYIEEPSVTEISKDVNRPYWEPSKYSTICSKNVLEEHIDRTSLNCVGLRENAIPTIDGYQFQDIKTEDRCKIEVEYIEEPSVTEISEDDTSSSTSSLTNCYSPAKHILLNKLRRSEQISSDRKRKLQNVRRQLQRNQKRIAKMAAVITKLKKEVLLKKKT